MKIYAVSDIHGCADAFYNALDKKIDLSGDNKLILLGDYIHGGADNFEVLDAIMHLQESYGKEKVIALLGNHEELVLQHRVSINNEIYNEYFFEKYDEDEDKYIEWLKELPLYHVEGNTIFVHAGVDEEAADLWEIGTADYIFTEKFPAQTGKFHMDIIAGHVGTCSISRNPNFHDIFFDGESHYYIDGTVCESGTIPVLMFDTDTKEYYEIKKTGAEIILPYDLPDKILPYGDEY